MNTQENEIPTSKRLEILKASLERKKMKLDKAFETHFATVKQANGQPLNDKRNGWKTLNKWDKQSDGIRAIQDSIKRTEAAIERETWKIEGCLEAQEHTPQEILDLVKAGKLTQWRKHPNFFFMAGVDKARLRWDDENKALFVRYHAEVKDPDQRKIMCEIYNPLKRTLEEKFKEFHQELLKRKKGKGKRKNA